VAGCCECGDEPSGSCATELVSYGPSLHIMLLYRSFENETFKMLTEVHT
jgi:hypothetical protein